MKQQRVSRSAVVIKIMDKFFTSFPTKWRAKEMAAVLDTGIRTTERALKDLLEAGILEKVYHYYSLNHEHVHTILGHNPYLRQETRKSIELGKHQ